MSIYPHTTPSKMMVVAFGAPIKRNKTITKHNCQKGRTLMSLLSVENPGDCRLRRGCYAFSSPTLDDLCTRLALECVASSKIPQEWLDNQEKRDVGKTSAPGMCRYHVTLCLPQELKNLAQKDEKEAAMDDFSNGLHRQPIFVSGVGITNHCAFVVLSFPKADAIRRKYGLVPREFHATLGFGKTGDDHEIVKSVETVSEHFQHNLNNLQQYWLGMARDHFQTHRNKQQTSDTWDLEDMLTLCRAIVLNIGATYPDEYSLMEQWGLLWCRVAGFAEKYGVVVEAADRVLSVKPQSAPALGYKGYAQYRQQKFDLALLNLDEAHSIFTTMPVKDKEGAKQQRQAHQVEDCLVLCCQALGRELPTPPLAKFPRTAHVFRPTDSKAVTPDDQVLSKDSAMLKYMTQTTVLLQEKVDGSNLGLSLSYDGKDVLVQNRSHYLNSGEHPQYGPLNTWIDMHREALLNILKSNEKRSSRHGLILYGEWMVARHSIPYHKLPSYFIAFDLYDIAEQRFYSQERFHSALRGTGIAVVPTVGEHQFDVSAGSIESQLMPFLNTKSKFRSDGGTLEGIVFRIDEGDWLGHRGKLVRPDFVSGIDQHWATRSIEKQTVNFDYSEEYLAACYDQAPSETELPSRVEQTRARFAVVYKGQNSTKRPDIVLSDSSNENDPLAVKMPRNLSWLWSNEVAVSSTPKKPEQIKAFYDAMGIRLVITLTEEQPLWDGMFFPGCQNTFSPVPNFCPPKIQQMDEIGDQIVRRIQKGEAVLEHCGGGKGRAGTVAACLLLRFGREGIRARIAAEGGTLFAMAPKMSSEEAINEIRRVRPESIETEIQEDFVREYAEHLWRKYTVEDELLGDTTAPSYTATSAPKKGAPKYLVLMGLPGAGKSQISKALAQVGKSPATKFVHAEQDEMGHKSCVDFVGRMSAKVARGEHAGLVLDCTNVTVRHRAEWLSVMHEPAREETALVYVQGDVEKCVRRVMARANHQTIPFGRGDTIVKGFAKSLEPPTDDESKRFGMVCTLESQADIESFLSIWGLAAS